MVPPPSEQWIDEGPVRSAAEEAVGRAAASPGARAPGRPRRGGEAAAGIPDEVGVELERVVGPSRAPRLRERLGDAARAFDRERYLDARRMLKPLAVEAPAAPAVRELLGLTLYRLGRWQEAARELEAFRTLTGSTEQHPVLADCYRALGRPDRVEALWEELRAASPGAGLVAEGRIVMAGTLADTGRLADGVRLLERAMRPTKRPEEHHLRQWYALAALYERAGDLPRARALFRRVAADDPGFADVSERLRTLR
ncbi:MAG: tetratricopeptide repeat protein [Acidimicrobiales bacterium]|nr:tetratricopeptide repeat protein [Acidimicrobiales bacterium]